MIANSNKERSQGIEWAHVRAGCVRASTRVLERETAKPRNERAGAPEHELPMDSDRKRCSKCAVPSESGAQEELMCTRPCNGSFLYPRHAGSDDLFGPIAPRMVSAGFLLSMVS